MTTVDSTSGDAQYNPDIWTLDVARRELVAEVERLHAEMEETRDTIADPATGYITRLAKTEAERDAARAEVEHLRRTVAGWRDSYERLSRQALRLRFAWQSARRGRKQARAELDDLAAQNAKTEDNFRDFAEDALAVQRERDRLAEQVKRVADEAEARAAKQAFNDPYEYGQAIGLRAVAAGLREVLDGTGDGSC